MYKSALNRETAIGYCMVRISYGQMTFNKITNNILLQTIKLTVFSLVRCSLHRITEARCVNIDFWPIEITTHNVR